MNTLNVSLADGGVDTLPSDPPASSIEENQSNFLFHWLISIQ